MGWWSTGHKDDVIGDDAADALVSTLEFHAEMNSTRPTFQELLDAAMSLIHRDGELFLCDPESARGKEMLATFEAPAPTLCSHMIDANSLMFDLTRVFERIAQQYLETDHNRKPRLTELLAAITFVLRVKPERFLRDTEGLELKQLRLEP